MNSNLDVIVPVFNEEQNIEEFAESLALQLAELKIVYRIYFIDDGSTDGTWSQIVKTMKTNEHITGIQMRINQGKDRALQEGMRASSGDYILSIDGDFQQPIDLIPEFWKKRNEAQAIIGLQMKRSQGRTRKIFSKFFYKTLVGLSGIDVPRNVGDFRLITKPTKDLLLRIRDPFTIYRFAITKLQISAEYLEFYAEPRRHGSSKYSLKSLVKLATESVLSISTRPLKLIGWVATSMCFLCLAEIAFVVANKIFGNPISGWTSVICLMSFCFMVIFISLTILGFYLARIYEIITGYPRI